MVSNVKNFRKSVEAILDINRHWCAAGPGPECVHVLYVLGGVGLGPFPPLPFPSPPFPSLHSLPPSLGEVGVGWGYKGWVGVLGGLTSLGRGCSGDDGPGPAAH